MSSVISNTKVGAAVGWMIGERDGVADGSELVGNSVGCVVVGRELGDKVGDSEGL
jgi:hypothetical protein